MVFKERRYGPWDLIRLPFLYAPWHTAARVFLAVTANLVPSFLVLMAAGFIDTAILVAKGEAAFSQALGYVVCVILGPIYQRVSEALGKLLDIGMENALRARCKPEIAGLRARLDYRYAENQQTRDLIERVCDKTDEQIKKMLDNALNAGGYVVQLCALTGILIAYAPWAVLILAAFCAPLFYIGYRGGKQMYDAKKDTTKLDRAAKSFSEILFSRENIDERSIFGYERDVNRRYLEAFEASRLHQKKVDRKNFVAMKTGSVLIVLSTAAMAVPLLYGTVGGSVSVGLFVTLLPTIYNFAQMLSWSLTYGIRQIKEQIEYLKDMTQFMGMDRVEDAAALPVSPPVPFESLEFQNVSFRYPGAEPYILKDLSLRIERGRHYAVVGVNGAGKTTLTKLITGLYGGYEGTILLNGRDLRAYSGAELKSLVSVVYQDFARYSLSLGENILLGDMNTLMGELEALRAKEADPGDPLRAQVELDFASALSGTESGRKLAEASRMLGLDEVAGRLPGGYNAHLGKVREDGVDLSGGEWQRVAMARAVVSPAGLKILDEPTAALDPISESNVYKEFEKISGGATTIFISHRLGSTRLADTILVVDGGRIAEQGTHEELMGLGGLYARMYRSQAEWYEEKAG